MVASAITDKGVTTAEDATFTVMAENISNISANFTDKFIAIAYIDFKSGQNTHGSGYNHGNYFTYSASNGTLTVKAGVKAVVFKNYKGTFTKEDKVFESATTFTIAENSGYLNWVIAIAYE